MIIIYKNFKIKSSYKGNKKHFDGCNNFNNHMIKVLNLETKNKITFEYWIDSDKDKISKISSKRQLMQAFLILLKEASLGAMRFKKYLSTNKIKQNTLSEDIKKKQKSYYKRCLKMNSKLSSIYNGDIIDLLNETIKYIQEA